MTDTPTRRPSTAPTGRCPKPTTRADDADPIMSSAELTKSHHSSTGPRRSSLTRLGLVGSRGAHCDHRHIPQLLDRITDIRAASSTMDHRYIRAEKVPFFIARRAEQGEHVATVISDKCTYRIGSGRGKVTEQIERAFLTSRTPVERFRPSRPAGTSSMRDLEPKRHRCAPGSHALHAGTDASPSNRLCYGSSTGDANEHSTKDLGAADAGPGLRFRPPLGRDGEG